MSFISSEAAPTVLIVRIGFAQRGSSKLRNPPSASILADAHEDDDVPSYVRALREQPFAFAGKWSDVICRLR